MVIEQRKEYPSEWAAVSSIAGKFGMTGETLRQWLRRAEVDGGQRQGLTSEERERMRALERENRELRRANEILKAASAFFAGSSTRDCRSGELHRRPPGTLGDRADLPGAAVRPRHVLRGPDPVAVGSFGTG